MMLKVRFVFYAAIFLSVFLLVAGCSNDKNINIEKLNKSEPRILLSNSSFVQESENMVYLADAIQRNDVDYLQQLIVENKVFVVDKDTKVDYFINDTNSNNAEIIFKEGRYTTKKGITLKNFLITEEEYPAYIAEKERQESRKANINYIFEVIHKSTTLVSYMETDNVYLIKQFLSDMKKYKRKLDELSNDANLDSDIRDMAKKALQL